MANNGLPPGATLVSGSLPSQVADTQTPDTSVSQPSTPGLPPGAKLVSGTVPSVPVSAAPASSINDADKWAFHTPLVQTPVAPPQDHREELVKSISGDRGLVSYRAAREAVGHVETLLKSPAAAYDAAKQAVQGIGDNMKKAIMPDWSDTPISQREMYATPVLPMPGVGSAARAFGAERAAAVAATPAVAAPAVVLKNPFSKPSITQQLLKGEKVAQIPAQEATRAAVKAGGQEVGLSTVQPASLRTIAEEPISAVNGMKKQIYGQVDKAAGTDIKTLYDKLDAINDKIDLEASGSPEEARLEAQRTSQMQTIEDAKAQARTKGVDVDKLLNQGDSLHTREMALRDLQKSFLKNVNTVPGNAAMGTPETIDVDSAVKALQKLQDNTKFGAPRLEQALGKAGAQELLSKMYAAQRMGVKAVSLQGTMKKILRLAEIGGGAIAGGELLKKAVE